MYINFHTGYLWPCSIVHVGAQYTWVARDGIVYGCALVRNRGAVEVFGTGYVPDFYYDACFLNYFGPAC